MKNNVRHDIPRTSKKIIVECNRKITTFPRFWRIYSIQLKKKARKERDSYLRSHETRLRNPKREGYESRAKSYFQKITVQTQRSIGLSHLSRRYNDSSSYLMFREVIGGNSKWKFQTYALWCKKNFTFFFLCTEFV